LAAELCAVLAFSAIKNNDKVGLLLFSDRVEEYIPPRRGKNHLLTVIRALMTAKPVGNKTDTDVPFRFLNKVMKRKTLTFFLSDMFFGEFPDSLRVAASKHEIVPVGVMNDQSYGTMIKGAVNVVDPESGKKQLLDFSRQDDRKFSEFVEEKEDSFKRLGLRPIWIRNRENFMDDLVNGFRKMSRVKKR